MVHRTQSWHWKYTNTQVYTLLKKGLSHVEFIKFNNLGTFNKNKRNSAQIFVLRFYTKGQSCIIMWNALRFYRDIHYCWNEKATQHLYTNSANYNIMTYNNTEIIKQHNTCIPTKVQITTYCHTTSLNHKKSYKQYFC